MLFLRREQGRLDELVETVESFADRYPDVPAWRCALAYTYAELDRRPDARRELDVARAQRLLRPPARLAVAREHHPPE